MEQANRTARRLAVFFAVYAILVFTIDTLALHRVQWGIDWSVFALRQAAWGHSPSPWLQALSGFDFYKFVAWFVIPLVICFPWLEGRWFSPRGWKRGDLILMGLLMGCGVVAVLSILVFPSLRAMYPSMRGLSGEQRWLFGAMQACWIVSWLMGWEFLTRYAILRNLKRGWPQYGWVCAVIGIPILETGYHLAQGKGVLESAAMFGFGLVLCGWALWRENALLPFLAHAFVEIALVIFLLII